MAILLLSITDAENTNNLINRHLLKYILHLLFRIIFVKFMFPGLESLAHRN